MGLRRCHPRQHARDVGQPFDSHLRLVCTLAAAKPPTGLAAALMESGPRYATFSYLAGVDPVDHSAAAAGLPPTDAVNTWPILSQNKSSGRTTIVLSANAVIVWPHKLVTGKQGGKGWWTGPVHPNASQPSIKDNNPGCSEAGCVFDIEADPAEHVDLSASLPAVQANLTATLAAVMSTAYQTKSTPGYTKCISASAFEMEHQGFLGPVCSEG